jgi:phosphoglycerol transferase MdoB-like AlkP superfamily enzyme
LKHSVAGPDTAVQRHPGVPDVRPTLRFLRRFLPAQAPSVLITVLVSAALVFCVELVVRGSLISTVQFFSQPLRPGWTTVMLFAVTLWLLDALLGRAHYGVLVLAPTLLLLAFVGHQKTYYLGDPLYPADILYVRQIAELFPLLAAQRPLTALGSGLGVLAGAALLIGGWRLCRHRLPRLTLRERLLRLVVALPALAFFVSMMDYASFSWTRDRLRIMPIMWDQKENYASNGFAIAFALNVPMAKVSAPPGYGREAIAGLEAPRAPVSMPAERPDIIMVMSESFWDAERLPGVTVSPEPIPTVRANSGGEIFSPEFGGMTANIEFEALTGFSNAFLPYGSIPYQQYVRAPMPSLPAFFDAEGYETLAIHPYQSWFWNRKNVYKDFGFERFLSVETIPEGTMAYRGPLASDAALTDQIIAQADAARAPVFLFAVSLQNHGPYEADRYSDPTHTVHSAMPSASNQSLLTYVEGAADADKGLKRLIEWAQKRKRPTVIAFWGDHLPPLGQVYVDSGFLKEMVPPRREPIGDLLEHHETPLVVWSNRTGPVRNIGTVSPSFLPLLVLESAGIEHPYYTGFLSRMRDDYRVIDRHALMAPDGAGTLDWLQAKTIDPDAQAFRLLQYDIMFGSRFGKERFFPSPATGSGHMS